MRAVVQDVYGETEVLHLEDVPRPAVRPGRVLVRVHAAGVDAGVWHLMAGRPEVVRLFMGRRGPRARTRGLDLAGVVEEVGDGVTAFRPGDRVFGLGDGSFAELALARPAKLATLPDGVGFEEAAAVPVSASTALQAVRDVARVRAGEHVLVVGASGGVGTFAVQLAKRLGAEVTGVCSAAKADLVRAIGADHVIDHAREEITDAGRRYDVVLDIAGNRPLRVLRAALAPRGTLVIVGGEGGSRWFGGLSRQLGALVLSPFVRQRLRMLVSTVRAPDLALLADLVARGELTPVVDRTYPLEQAGDAVRHQHEGRARGKVVLTVEQSRAGAATR